MSGVFTVFIFFIVIALTAVIFFGWIVFTIVRLIIGGIQALFIPDHRSRAAVTPGVRCQTRGCFAVNPPQARFCRRCGRALPVAQHVDVRRAAVW
jgi:hypothetical protein